MSPTQAAPWRVHAQLASLLHPPLAARMCSSKSLSPPCPSARSPTARARPQPMQIDGKDGRSWHLPLPPLNATSLPEPYSPGEQPALDTLQAAAKMVGGQHACPSLSRAAQKGVKSVSAGGGLRRGMLAGGAAGVLCPSLLDDTGSFLSECVIAYPHCDWREGVEEAGISSIIKLPLAMHPLLQCQAWPHAQWSAQHAALTSLPAPLPPSPLSRPSCTAQGPRSNHVPLVLLGPSKLPHPKLLPRSARTMKQ